MFYNIYNSFRIHTLKKVSILPILLVLACSFNLLQAQTTVKGNVSNVGEGDVIRLIVDSTFIGLTELKLEDKLEDKVFEFDVELKEPTIAYLALNKTKIPLFLEPNDQLEMTFDKDSIFTEIAFAGQGSANNDFLHKYNKKFATVLDKYAMEDKMKEQNIDVFEIELFDSNKAQEKYIKDNLDKFEQTKSFQAYIKQQNRYSYLGSLLAYPIIRGNADKTKTDVDPLPRVMMDVVKDEWINSDEAMLSDWYRYFVEYYTVYKTSETNDFQKFQDYTTSVESKYVYARQNLEGEPFKYFLAKYLQENYEKIKPSSVRWIFNHLQEEDLNKRYITELDKMTLAKRGEEDPVEEVAEKSKPSKTSKADALMFDWEGNPLSFDDYKGQVIYVDFWASWCGPCRKQFPYAKELKEKLFAELSKKEKQKIVFLYISIDDTEQGWKGAVEKLGMEGEQAHSPGGWNSKVVKQFKIQGIPRYMLINKKGSIIEMNAKRPSDPLMLDMLLELIKE